MKKIILILLCAAIFTSCNNAQVNEDEIIKVQEVQPEEYIEPDVPSEPHVILNEDGDTIKTRYNPPEGFTRTDAKAGSFGEFLQNQVLKPYGEKALYFDGRAKNSEGIYDSVIEVDIGDRDLHQCADAIMLLWAEHNNNTQEYDKIRFNFVNGFLADYPKWVDGYRISVGENSTNWVKKTDYSTSYESFRKYMDMVFAYAGTLSLDKELTPVSVDDMQIGDVFIQGGSPGHAVVVVDMAQNTLSGEKVFMLAQSYMPAQQTQVLINRETDNISPWYLLHTGEEYPTPEWKFTKDNLKRFDF